MNPFALHRGEGRTLEYGIPHLFKLGEVSAGRGAAIFELDTCAGEEPPLHTHGTEDEVFYVLSGQITFHCGGNDFFLREGGFMFLPRGIRHGYTIAPDQRVRLLVITYPVREPASAWGGYAADVERAVTG